MNPNDTVEARLPAKGILQGRAGAAPGPPQDAGEVEEALWHLQSAMNSSLNAIAMSDLKGVFIYANQAFVSLWGFNNVSEVLGRSAVAFLGPPGEVTEVISHVLEHGSWSGEMSGLRRDGTHFDAQVYANVFTDRSGRVAGMRASFVDLTDRKRVGEVLKQSEKRYRELFQNMSSGVVVYEVVDDGAEFIIKDINSAGERIEGVKHEEVVGRRLTETFPGVTQLGLLEVLQRVWRTGIPEHLSAGRYEDDRRCGWRENNVYKISAGEIVAVYEDVTERKRAEDALRSFALAVENSSDAIGISTPEGRHYYHNKVFGELFGEAGECPQETLYADTQLGFQILEIIKAGKTWTGEVKFRGREGQPLDILLRAYAIKDDSGKILGLVGIHTDITAAKRAEEDRSLLQAQLHHAQKMESIGRLAGGVAHDFNNMLMVIIGYAEMVLEQMDPADSFHASLLEIRQAALRSAKITSQLLGFARKQARMPVVLDLNEAIEGILMMLRRLIGENIEFVWTPRPDLWRVFMDPAQISQILTNLCVNARDAIDGVGKITVETDQTTLDKDFCTAQRESSPGDYVVFTVSDTGCGMDKKTLNSIFEPFFTTKDSTKGTGLGMANVYGIVKQNNGFITVASELGVGTSIKIYLPRCGGEPGKVETPRSQGVPSGAGETVLLVEDEPAILTMGRRLLERLGYRVLVAGLPGAALDLARNHEGEIQLLITDMVMPEMNGRVLAERILKLCPGMRVLFMSGYTSEHPVYEGVMDGGVNFLQKPFSVEELATKVHDLMGGPGERRKEEDGQG